MLCSNYHIFTIISLSVEPNPTTPEQNIKEQAQSVALNDQNTNASYPDEFQIVDETSNTSFPDELQIVTDDHTSNNPIQIAQNSATIDQTISSSLPDELQIVDESSNPDDFHIVDETSNHPDISTQEESSDFQVIDEDDFFPLFQQKTLQGLLEETELHTREPKTDILIYIRNIRNHLEHQIKQVLSRDKGLKFWVALKVQYVKPTLSETTPLIFYLKTGFVVITNEFQIPETLNTIQQKLMLRNAHFIREQSGLVIDKILATRFKVAKYLPLSGGAYAELPEFLSRKKAIVNINNLDNRCFGYAVAAALTESDNGHNLNRYRGYYPMFHRYGLDRIDYPVFPHQISVIEDQLQININLFSFYDEEGRARYPIYISQKEFDQTVDLLYWDEHYAWIKSFSRFMGDVNRHKGKLFWCKRCLGHFQREQALETHKLYCRRIDYSDQIFTMPEEGSKISFKHIRFQARLPFVIIADFETLTSPTGLNAPDPGKKSFNFQHHIPCAMGLKLISNVWNFQFPYTHWIGEDCVQRFLDAIIDLERRCVKWLTEDVQIYMTESQKRKHRTLLNVISVTNLSSGIMMIQICLKRS